MADINISLGLIDNSFKQAMKAINAEINDTNKTAKELDKQFNNLDNSMDNVTQQTEILRKNQDNRQTIRKIHCQDNFRP